MDMYSSVTILGCGPSGLFAAYAAERLGFEVSIFSNKRRSEMFGAQYMHISLPDLDVPETIVDYQLLGSIEGYRRRVYGANFSGEVSVELLRGKQPAWDIRTAYDLLYDRYESQIINCGKIDGKFLLHAASGMRRHDIAIINTIPRKSICMNQSHQFAFESVWAAGDAPERDKWCPIEVPLDTVVCNGLGECDESPEWYRASNLFGYKTAEWPYRTPPNSTLDFSPSLVRKPISTDCDCHPGVIHIGRYGQWKKGVLSHHAYLDTIHLLQDRKSNA